MSKKETVKRYILFIISLFISAVGVAFTKHGELGVSPISSVANILSIRFDFFTMGVWLIIWNCALILGQILILRKNFDPIQLLQIPLSFLFGYFTDFGMWIVGFIPVDNYIMQLLCVMIGVAVLGFGISVAVSANVIMNSGEAFVKAISDVSHKEFGNIKIAFDISCVLLAVILSLLLCDFQIKGAREGTVISAFCTGLMVKLFRKLTDTPLNRLVSDKK